MQKKIVIREADALVACTAFTDHEIGCAIQAIEDISKLNNTLIIYIDGDNGTSSVNNSVLCRNVEEALRRFEMDQ